MSEPRKAREVIVVGDVHGQFEAFVQILRHAQLLNEKLEWIGGRNRLVQMGDILDRGPESASVDDLLDRVQREALSSGGEIVRLIGNHELELLMSNFVISGFDKAEAKLMRDKLTRQVLDYEIRAAYAYKGFLLTHAGVTRKLLRIFQMQLDVVNENNIAMLINMIFKEAIKHEFFKHPLFNISISRSGTDKFGGIFWEDLDDLIASYQPDGSPLKQIVGHTQVDQIQLNNGFNIIPVDIGLHRRKQYLKIANGTLSVQEVL